MFKFTTRVNSIMDIYVIMCFWSRTYIKNKNPNIVYIVYVLFLIVNDNLNIFHNKQMIVSLYLL